MVICFATIFVSTAATVIVLIVVKGGGALIAVRKCFVSSPVSLEAANVEM